MAWKGNAVIGAGLSVSGLREWRSNSSKLCLAINLCFGTEHRCGLACWGVPQFGREHGIGAFAELPKDCGVHGASDCRAGRPCKAKRNASPV